MTDGRAAGITGASGFVGSALCRAFRADGVPVVAFTRDAARVSAAGVEARPYAISDVPELAGIGVLVHCAIATEGEHDDVVRRNVDGALALYRAASRAGIRFVFVSSLSAEGEASSAYAEQKRRIESLLGGDALIVRPGLIAGAGGLFQRLRATASRPVVPLIDGGRQTVQIVAIDDVCSAVRVALDARLAGAHNVVAPPPLTLRDVVVA
ncbi:MAG TPA: NAD-dependent epimerase/dehydratase family protein, partial [Candidatus Elarobacter sp.]|nr:NAD-dependent epimerase/dehydratase family protein [Candidatus Elarobacter sp.]